MAAIVWDDSGKRFFETGVKHGVLYPMSSGAYPLGVAWNGLTSVSINPTGGEPESLYADDMKYATMISNEEFEASISAYMYPDEFMECDGSIEAVSGVYLGQQARKAFGLVFETTVGNDENPTVGYKLHIIYGCYATPSDKEYQTVNDSPDAIEFNWDVKTTPVPTPLHPAYRPVSYICIDSRTADADKLAALKLTLFGDTNTDPTLPLPDAIITAMTPGTPPPNPDEDDEDGEGA